MLGNSSVAEWLVDSQEGLSSIELIICSSVLAPKTLLKNELSENVNLYSAFTLGDQVSINYLHETIFLQQPVLAHLIENRKVHCNVQEKRATVSYTIPINITESIR
jgi:hypothetical protein